MHRAYMHTNININISPVYVYIKTIHHVAPVFSSWFQNAWKSWCNKSREVTPFTMQNKK